MPEYRMVFMSDGEYEAFGGVTNYFRKMSDALPELRSDFYMMANQFQEVVDRMWESGFTISPSELIYEGGINERDSAE